MKITKERVKNFFKKYKNYFIVFGIWFLVLNLSFISNGAWPYGSNTISNGSDTYIQICAFFEHIFAWLKGDVSLFYTSQLAGGVEILSTLMYMLLNPFYIIVLICGAKNIYTSINFAMFFMLLFNGFVMLWFLNKRYNHLSSWWKVIFSTLFTFCAYSLFNFVFVTWYIFPGICLLLFDAFLELVQNNKIWRFSGILVWLIVNCVTTSISSFLTIILLFFGYIMFFVPKETRKETFVRLFVGVVIGALISIAILTPIIYSLLKTNRTSSFFEKMTSKEVKFDYLRLTALLLELSVFVFPIIYIIEIFKTNKKEFYFCLSSLIVLILPFFFNFIISALTGGTINSLTLRYYFVAEVFMFLISIKFVDKKLQAQTDEKMATTSGPIKIISICVIALGIFVSVLAFAIMFKSYPTHIKNVDSDVGGITVTSLFFIFTLISFLMVYFEHKFKKISFKFFKNTTYIIMCFGLLINSLIYISPQAFDKTADTDICQMVSSLNSDGKIKYLSKERINKLSLPVGCNMFFSSLMSREVADSFDSLGYSVNTVYLSSSTGDLIADSLTGNNYYFSQLKLDRPYLTLERYDDEKRYYIYKNSLASSGAVVFNKSFVYDKDASYFKNIENLQSSYGLSGTLYEDITFVKTVDDDNNITYSYTASSDCIIYVNYLSKTLGLDKFGYYFTVESIPKNDKYWSDFTFVEAGETFTFTYYNETEDENYFPAFKTLNYEAAEALCEEFIASQAQITTNKNGFEIKLNGKEGNLFVSSPKIEGYQVLVDGTKIEDSTQFGGFLSVSVSSSNQQIKVTYTAPYIWLWVIMIIVCSLLVVLLCLWHKKTALKKLETVIYVFWWCLVCCILSVFYLFCILLTFFKLIL